MKFSILVGQLDKVASQMLSIVNSSPVSPIDAYVLIEVGSSTVNFTATDRQSELKITVPILAEREGTATVRAQILSSIAKSLPKDDVCEFDLDPERAVLNVSSGSSHFDLQTLPPDDFPKLTNDDDFGQSFAIKTDILKDLLDRTKFAISREEQRVYLKGVHFNTQKKGRTTFLDAVATDGFRMAVVSTKAPKGLKDFPGIIISEKAITTLTRVFGAGGEIKVQYSDTKIRFVSDGIQFTSLLIMNDFPEYSRLIPQDTDLTMTLDCAELSTELRKVLTVSRDTKEVVEVKIAKDRTHLRVSSIGQGLAETEVASEYTGENELELRFIGIHLSGIIEVMAEGQAIFTLNESNGAIKITKQDDDSAVFIVMPLKP